ncbi:MAG: DrmB family protein [Pseudanabaena sp.]
MTNRYRIGELRPSQIMFSYGIGAIADLPNLAAMVMGLEDWQRQHTQVISEDRLLAAVQEQLGGQVQQLVSLPIPEEESRHPYLNQQPNLEGIPVAPFPTWMVCPKCDLLAPITDGLFELKTPRNRHSEAAYHHINCTKGITPRVIPVRFLTACEKGHLDDFPWRYFVHRGSSDCKGSLRLIEPSVSGAVTDIMIKCDTCGASRRMSDAFGLSGKQNMPRCRGRHPHLRSFDDKCDRQMKTMLLGASNSWFSLSLSALSIPNAENKLEQYIDSYWLTLEEADSADTLKAFLRLLQKQGKAYELENYDIQEIWQAIAKRKNGSSQESNDHISRSDLKTPEWLKFKSVTGLEDRGKDWRLKAIAPPVDFDKVISKVIRVEKLREVRSLIGFTRIQSSGDFTDTGEVPKEYRAPLSRRDPTWVPAMEVRGEGIFIEFNETALQAWEQQPAVKKQHIQVREAHKNWLNQRNPELVDKISTPDMRYLLIHSFSHALMRQLAIECGYNAASLRERIYAQVATSDRQAQAGLLIYTAAPDSEGTLGGLVYLGEAPRLNHHIHQALESIRICTSDPLCAEHDPAGDRVSLHWAACHACLFSPETSCERGNKFLDRALLVPTFSQTDICFFN